MIQLLLAVLAGFLTVAAPCILPMLPILLGTSIGQTSRARPLFIASGFILSFSGFALLFGTVPDILGLSPDALRTTAIVMLFTFGILMIWHRPMELLAARAGGIINFANDIGGRGGSGNMGGFLLGMSLGIVWTPCAGPILGSILALIASAKDLGQASLLLLCYSIGAGLPMLAIAYGGQFTSTRVRWFARYTHLTQKAFGVVIIFTSFAIYHGYDTQISSWLADYYPNLKIGF